MKRCCVNCFKDLNIRKTIEKNGFIDDCDFCSSKNSHVIDISDPDNPLSEKNQFGNSGVCFIRFLLCKALKTITAR